MYVLLLAPAWDENPTDGSRPVPELAAALRRAGHTVGAIALAPGGLLERRAPLEMRVVDGITLVEEGGAGSASPRGGRGSGLLLRRRTRQALEAYVAQAGSPDVVHGLGVVPAVHMTALAGAVLGCGVVLSTHGGSSADEPGPGAGRVRADLQRVAIRAADTEELRERLTRAWHVGAWRVLPTVDDAAFAQGASSLYAQAVGAVELERVRTDNVDC